MNHHGRIGRASQQSDGRTSGLRSSSDPGVSRDPVLVLGSPPKMEPVGGEWETSLDGGGQLGDDFDRGLDSRDVIHGLSSVKSHRGDLSADLPRDRSRAEHADLELAGDCDDRTIMMLGRLDSRAQDAVWSVRPAVPERLRQDSVPVKRRSAARHSRDGHSPLGRVRVRDGRRATSCDATLPHGRGVRGPTQRRVR